MTTANHRAVTLAALVSGLLVLLGIAAAPPASAHPLGNATVNHYDGLHLYPDHITDDAIEDIAEIPTLQRRPQIDTNGDNVISATERATYAARQCAALAAINTITINGHRLTLSVIHSDYTERPGAIHLRIGRLVCALAAPADLSAKARIGIDAEWDSAGIGWHEITAVTSGVTLQRSPVPATSISDRLLRYPNDMLSSPEDVRSTSLITVPGAGASTYAAAHRLPVTGFAVRQLGALTESFNGLVGTRHLTLGVGLLALLLSLVLGAGHAFLPGHGKTIMAAYLVGRRGRLRDVITVGATVTMTHTAGVLVLGLLISASAAFAPTAAEQYLAILSGLIVTGVGVGLLAPAVRHRRMHDHPHPHTHPHGRDDAEHAHQPTAFGRGGLIGLGIAGGLVPSPSALLVLLAAVALGRTLFGVVLVLAYGLGMAAALTATGLLLVRLRLQLGRFSADRLPAPAGALVAALPMLTAGLVLTVGIGLTLRAVAGTI